MAKSLDAIFETKVKVDENSGQPHFNSPKLTLSVLRFVANMSLILGLFVGIGSFILFLVAVYNDKSVPTAFFVSIGALAQGFIIFALFNALALIVENLVGIRKNLTQTRDKV